MERGCDLPFCGRVTRKLKHQKFFKTTHRLLVQAAREWHTHNPSGAAVSV